jgi:hypothetical protein
LQKKKKRVREWRIWDRIEKKKSIGHCEPQLALSSALTEEERKE